MRVLTMSPPPPGHLCFVDVVLVPLHLYAMAWYFTLTYMKHQVVAVTVSNLWVFSGLSIVLS